VFFWGETDMLWTDGVVELLRWRRRDRAVAASARLLIEEAEAWLADMAGPPHRSNDLS
jgi:hypothetical protein